jgi:hypothetical protein
VHGESADDQQLLSLLLDMFALEVISAYFSTSKKSADLRWLSLAVIPVLMLAAVIITLTDDLVMSLSSWVSVAAKSVNLPLTFDKPPMMETETYG